MSRSTSTTGKPAAKPARRRKAQKKGRADTTSRGRKIVQSAAPWALAGGGNGRGHDDGVDDAMLQGEAIDWGEQGWEPQERAIAAKADTMRGLEPDQSWVPMRDAMARLDGVLGSRGTIYSVVHDARGRVERSKRPRWYVGLQVDHVRNAGPEAVEAMRDAVEWTRAFNIVHREHAEEAEFSIRHMGFDETQDIIETGKFRVLPKGRSRFTALTLSYRLKRYDKRAVKMRVKKEATDGEPEVVRYSAHDARIQGKGREMTRSPKSPRQARERELRVPPDTRVDLKGIHLVVRRDRLSRKQIRWLASKKDLLGSLKWA